MPVRAELAGHGSDPVPQACDTLGSSLLPLGMVPPSPHHGEPSHCTLRAAERQPESSPGVPLWSLRHCGPAEHGKTR